MAKANDYGFRIYNPGIGRFLSVDPLAHERSWVSPYNYVQNNPINRVDPNGTLDDYYFTRDGQYLGTDNSGNKIRIVDKFSEKSVKNTLDNLYVQSSESIASLKEWNTDITELNGALSDNAQSNIAVHFYEALGYSKNELKDGTIGSRNSDLATTSFENGKFDIKLRSGSIGKNLRNADDVKNMLVHERGGHGTDFINGLEYNINSSDIFWSWEKRATRLQVNHSTWSGTSDIFRNIIYDAYGKHQYIFSKMEQARYFPNQIKSK